MLRALSLISLMLIILPSAFAGPAKKDTKASSIWETIKAKTNIRVNSYDPEMDAFDVTVVAEEAVGPLIVTPEALAKALSRGDDIRTQKSSKTVVGNEYVTDTPLPVLTQKAQLARKAANKH